MLVVIDKIGALSYSELMAVYEESNGETGGKSDYRRLMAAEQEFYGYLRDCFFREKGARMFVWTDQGKYISALRAEPWRDGILISGLETRPEYRGMGYAGKLLRRAAETMAAEGARCLYSHVAKNNAASLAVHRKCGFAVSEDRAVFLDGSADNRSVTMKIIF